MTVAGLVCAAALQTTSGAKAHADYTDDITFKMGRTRQLGDRPRARPA